MSYLPKKARFLVVVLIFVISLAFVVCGCSSPQEKSGTDISKEPVEVPEESIYLNIATSTTGGTFYPIGGKLADMITKHVPNVKATAEATKGSVENARLLANGEAGLALIASDTLYNAINGIEEFEKEGAYNITQIGALFKTPLQFVALKDSGIKTINDLKGKKVSIGAPGSSAATRGELIMNAHGVTLDDIKIDRSTSGEAATQMSDGQIDAAIFSAGAPTSAIMDLAFKRDIRLLPITPDAWAALEVDHPYLYSQNLPVDIYKGIEEETFCAGSVSILICDAELSEEHVYEITKMIFERMDEFKTAHSVLEKDLSLDAALSQEAIASVHPGALRYYKEVGLVK